MPLHLRCVLLDSRAADRTPDHERVVPFSSRAGSEPPASAVSAGCYRADQSLKHSAAGDTVVSDTTDPDYTPAVESTRSDCWLDQCSTSIHLILMWAMPVPTGIQHQDCTQTVSHQCTKCQADLTLLLLVEQVEKSLMELLLQE